MARAICVIGNSHIGALKLGWERLKGNYDHQLSFLGVPGAHFRKLAVQDGKVVATTQISQRYFSKTMDTEAIALESYDAIIVVAAGLGLLKTMELTDRWRPYWLLDDGALGASAEFDLVSTKVFEELVAAKVRKSFAHKFVSRISQQGAAAVLYMPTPLPSSDAKLRTQYTNPVLGLLTGAKGRELASVYFDAVEKVMRSERVMRPPAHILVDGAMTDSRYSRGSVRLDSESDHPEHDLQHMNADYGALILEAALDRLAGNSDWR
ncbi:hypothetical protein [Rhizobium sp. GN54]|uniref:hypothetical protein n=1 Tax=Rhizobium sp. GN54 TaxID=2898150 RepID=UPI001E3D2796|nr:hypothetical protein [Rhizobium sp. GN54]MCD2181236.1 hypothetical protein [Rhizobium sp. GN54]